jgi:hypothetical protein
MWGKLIEAAAEKLEQSANHGQNGVWPEASQQAFAAAIDYQGAIAEARVRGLDGIAAELEDYRNTALACGVEAKTRAVLTRQQQTPATEILHQMEAIEEKVTASGGDIHIENVFGAIRGALTPKFTGTDFSPSFFILDQKQE